MKDLSFMRVGLAALAATALLWAVPAKAQTHVARFTIPFQFGAGNDVYPAGQYEVVLDQFARILLRNSNGTGAHFVALYGKYARRSSPNLSPATLRFERYDGAMYLTAAWAPGYEDGRTVRPSGKLAEAMRASRGGNGSAIVTLDASVR